METLVLRVTGIELYDEEKYLVSFKHTDSKGHKLCGNLYLPRTYPQPQLGDSFLLSPALAPQRGELGGPMAETVRRAEERSGIQPPVAAAGADTDVPF